MPPVLFRSLLAADRKATEQLNEVGKVHALEKVQALSAELAGATRFTGAQAVTSRQFATGSGIYQAGEVAKSAFFVMSGEINLFPPGCPVPHETVGAGLIFGDREVALDSPQQF